MGGLQQGDIVGNAFPYRIERRIDHVKGNMSEVYLAYIDPSLARGVRRERVVLKVARVQSRNDEFNSSGLINEVEHIRSLTHPGIVHIYPIQQEGLAALPFRARSSLSGEPWFSVLEYLQGETLARRLSSAPQKRLPLEQSLFIARSLAGTLDYLHRCNIVHMDLKPENVLFRFPLEAGKRMEPVLIDFGVACEAGQLDQGGTLRYKAPERIAGPPVQAHPSIDIYAVGVILYQMLTGRMPFTGVDRGSITEEIRKGEITAPSIHYEPLDGRSGVREHLDEVIRKTMHRDLYARYTAAELAEALEIATLRLGEWPVLHLVMPGMAYPDSPMKPFQRESAQPSLPFIPLKRVTAIGVGVLAIGLLLGFLIGYFYLQPMHGEPTTPTAVASMTAVSATAVENKSPITLPTATSTPFSTDTPAPTPSATDNVTSPPAPITIAPTVTPITIASPTENDGSTDAAPVFGQPAVALLSPDDGARVAGFVTYCWSSSRDLVQGEAFELFIWKPDLDFDKENSGPAIADPIEQSSISNRTAICTEVNLSRVLDENALQISFPEKIVRFRRGDEMFWGIRLIAPDGKKSWLGVQRTVIPE